MKYAGISLFLMAVCAVAQQSSLKAPYRNWLNEDVAYMITDEERSDFVRLQTDRERDEFIEQFWLRRDPTPDTIENEFRDEHYWRIAYANEKFGSSIPGWKTDRGRIYVTYGPPDEIDEHPPASLPCQEWHYRYLFGVGTNVIVKFVDPAMSGEFHLTEDSVMKNVSPYLEGQRIEDFGGDDLSPRVSPPKTRFPDLEARMIQRHYSDFRRPAAVRRMPVHLNFFPVTSATVLMYVTVDFTNKELHLQNQDDVSSANVGYIREIHYPQSSRRSL